ncbi:MAG: phosphodiester glycosidase family protein [Planctomycetes bacterium]|nr:phosphodiester glycosidase family protein [Planctomycetota bacterium]
MGVPVLRRVACICLLLLAPARAQDLSGRWTVAGRDAEGPYRGHATLTHAQDRLEGPLELERLRVTATGALEPTGARLAARLEARVAGAVVEGQRTAPPGLAGAVGGAPGSRVPVRYALQDEGGQLRLTAPGEALHRDHPTGPAADEARPGDWSAPLVVPRTPFVHASTTAGRRSLATRYSARPTVSQEGPEVVYRVDVPARGRLTAWVQGDGAPAAAGQTVDVDVHVLRSLELDASGQAVACLARDDVAVEVEVEAGTYYVVVDTYTSFDRAGAYTLRIDVAPDDAWYERPVAQGVRLRTKRYPALFGAPQTGSVLDVDLAAPGVVVKPIVSQGCATPSALGRRAGAVAAINGGFFDGSCASVSLAKVDGAVWATNARDRSALGFDARGRASIALVAAGQDWPQATHALGGLGRLLDGGAVVIRPGAEQSQASFATSRHPRTAVGVTPQGGLVLATVDGRTAAGAGMKLDELAQWMAWLGCRDALNLDGGGSTALWVRGEPFGGVVNHPCDNRKPDRAGERGVSTALAVWARPLDEDAVWLTPAPAGAVAAGAAWTHEVVAADPEGARVRFRLEGAPPGLALVDRGDGTARLAWPPGGPASVTFRLVGAVEGSRPVARTISLRRS